MTLPDADINKATNRFATGTTYDEAGQVVADNKFRSFGFAYDANGRQVKATKTGVPDAWTVYDALGNRVATKINDIWQYMIYDAFGKLVAEYGLPSEGTGGVKYIQQDWQGSVRTVTNKGAFVVSRTDHQAFGEEIGAGIGLRTAQQGYGISSSARQGYGLTEKDETGLNHTWFRKNENKAGRWTSPDPYKGSMSLGNPQSFNRYSYVGSNPTNFVDPSGLVITINVLSCGYFIADYINDEGQWDSIEVYGCFSSTYYFPTMGNGGTIDGGTIGGGGGSDDKNYSNPRFDDCVKEKMKDLSMELLHLMNKNLITTGGATLAGSLTPLGPGMGALAGVAYWKYDFESFKKDKYDPALKKARWDCLPNFIRSYFQRNPKLSYLNLWNDW